MIGDYLNAGLLLVTAIGVVAVFWEIRSGAQAQRASFLRELYGDLRTDSGAYEAFYKIEYDEFRYDEHFHGSPLEPKIDSLLTQIDLICEMHARGMLSKKEMGFFDYEIARVAQSPEIAKYLDFLREFYRSHDLDREPFAALQTYAARQTKGHKRVKTVRHPRGAAAK